MSSEYDQEEGRPQATSAQVETLAGSIATDTGTKAIDTTTDLSSMTIQDLPALVLYRRHLARTADRVVARAGEVTAVIDSLIES